jgi:hypothetical protein
MRAGARLMPIGAASAALAGAAGLVAYGSVEVSDEAHDVMVTHRNLNLGLIAASIVLAVLRGRTRKPTLPYLAAGLAGVAAMNYTAYLGGKLVYQHGVGVEKAGGVRPENSPELKRGQAARALSASVSSAAHAAKHTVSHLRSGDVAPTLASAQ